MALVKCKECGHQVSDQADACPNCGAKPAKPTSRVAWFFGGLFAIAVAMMVANSGESHRSGSGNLPIVEATPSPPPKPTWRYETYTDPASGKSARLASIDSENKVNFGFPYAGEQPAELLIYKHPRYGQQVSIGLKKAQFLCHTNDCFLNVRFDGGQVQRFSAVGPADHSTNVVFFQNEPRFLALAQKAKRIYIEATFYQQGGRTFEFSTDGLDLGQLNQVATK